MTPEQEILADHLGRVVELIDGFERDRAAYAALFPIGGNLFKLENSDADRAFAFVKRFELLVDSVNRRLIRSIAAIEGIRVQTAKLADLNKWASERGLVPTGNRWKHITELRNILAHEYLVPLSEFTPVANDAWAATSEVIAAARAIETYIKQKGLLREPWDDNP